MRLEGKVALVTGGGSGFGEAIVKRFAEEGAKLIVADVADENGEHVASEVEKAQGQGSAFIHADVARDADAEGMIAAAVDRFGRLDILVNNAGVTHRRGPMLDVPEAMVDKILAVNVKAIWLAA